MKTNSSMNPQDTCEVAAYHVSAKIPILVLTKSHIINLGVLYLPYFLF